jgi:hypothetical protein
MELFQTYRVNTGRLLKFIIEGAFAREVAGVRQHERRFA